MNCQGPFRVGVWLVLLFPVWAQTDNVDDFIQAEMQKRHLPAVAIAVVRDGKIVKQRGYGLANVELNVAASDETVFYLASITKIFTATAVMTLVEEGKISLADRVRKLLPTLPVAWDNIRVRHLLTHTSGLPDTVLNDDTGEVIANTRAEALRKLARVPLLNRPGAKWSYNETGYVLLGMVIEKVSGLSLTEFLSRRFFCPLNMVQTHFEIPGKLSPGAHPSIRDMNIKLINKCRPMDYGHINTLSRHICTRVPA